MSPCETQLLINLVIEDFALSIELIDANPVNRRGGLI